MADTIPIPDRESRPPRGETPPRTKPPRDDATSRRGQGDTGMPPRDGSAQSSAPTRPRRRTKDDTLILESLTGMYGMIGAGIAGVGQVQGNAGLVAAGINITVQGETLAQQWLDLGAQVPAVRRAMESMIRGGAVSVVVMGNAGIVLPVLSAVGVIPQQLGNVFLAPEAVEAGQAYQAMQTAAAATGGNGTPSP